jgi:hypothetical protein
MGTHWIERSTKQGGPSSSSLFFLANEIRATVFGIDGEKMVRRAIERILGDSRSGQFNALEITRLTSLESERFPVVHYVSVCAHSRHIQESLILFSAKNPQRLGPSNIDCCPHQSTGLANSKGLLQGTMIQANVASILNR